MAPDILPWGYLRRLPIDFLKVDRSFVAGMGSNADDDAIVRAIVSLASALRLNTIAEGVERPSQVAQLVEMGCPTLQGFYLGRPSTADAIDHAIATPGLWEASTGSAPNGKAGFD